MKDMVTREECRVCSAVMFEADLFLTTMACLRLVQTISLYENAAEKWAELKMLVIAGLGLLLLLGFFFPKIDW